MLSQPTEDSLEIEGVAYKDPEKRREAHNKYMREVWYPANRKKHQGLVKSYARGHRKEVADVINEMKRKPCMDCGLVFPPICMDFDHRPGTKKVRNVSQMVRDSSLNTVLVEISKCDLVCSNCHRIRTHSRENG